MTFARPRLWPTLFTMTVVVLCLGLGVWQVQRLHWKEGLIAQRAAALAAPPVGVPQTLAQARALQLRRVTDEGVFLNDKQILVHAIGPDGEAGFYVLTPLREAGGRVVFVNRGFVPGTHRAQARRRESEAAGTVRIAGRLLLPARPGLFVPDNRPDRKAWFWVDLSAMSRAAGLSDVAPFYIAADATPHSDGWPKGGVALPALPNHHLQYAITWFSLAGAMIVIFVLYHRRKADAA